MCSTRPLRRSAAAGLRRGRQGLQNHSPDNQRFELRSDRWIPPHHQQIALCVNITQALPITKRVARNGKVSYTFQIDAGTKPDGSRDRRRYTYATLAEARREYARITTEASAGTLVRRDKVTVGAFLTEWLDSRRVRPNTLDGYRAALKPVIDHLGTVPLQHLDTAHLDELVTLRLTSEPIDAGLVAVNPDGSPIRPETYSEAFRRHCAAAGVPVIRLHDTRHTAATRMLDCGTTVLRQRSGWATIRR